MYEVLNSLIEKLRLALYTLGILGTLVHFPAASGINRHFF